MNVEELRRLWTARLNREAVFEQKMTAAVLAVPRAIQELLGDGATVYLTNVDGAGTIPLPPPSVPTLIDRYTLVAVAAAQLRFSAKPRDVSVLLPFQTRLVNGEAEYFAVHHRTRDKVSRPQNNAHSMGAALLSSLKEALSWDPFSGVEQPRAIGFLPPSERG